ncbi:hypothetical protein DRN93_04210 [archaeon]|nr:MAG: hypothetical protein DRN93_04210 [archaeon]
MELREEIVRTQDGQEWSFSMPLPETLEEAQDVYGADGALYLLVSGLKVKLQAIAREAFKRGASREDVERLVKDYRPGGQKKSMKERAMELITEKADLIKNDPEMKEELQALFVRGRWGQIVEKLEQL